MTILRLLAEGRGIHAVSKVARCSARTIDRYGQRHPRFGARMLEAKALAQMKVTNEEAAVFAAAEPKNEDDQADDDPVSHSLPQAPEPPPDPVTEIIEPEIVDEDEGRTESRAFAPTRRRSYEAFLDKSFEYFTDESGKTPLALRVSSQQTLRKHYDLLVKRDALIDVQRDQRDAAVRATAERTKGLMSSATEQIFAALAGPPPTACPACGRTFWQDPSGGMRPHFPDVDPRADGWAREARSLAAEGLCPGVVPDAAEAAEAAE